MKEKDRFEEGVEILLNRSIFLILLIIAGNGRPMRLKEIAEKYMNLKKKLSIYFQKRTATISTVSRILNKLNRIVITKDTKSKDEYGDGIIKKMKFGRIVLFDINYPELIKLLFLDIYGMIEVNKGIGEDLKTEPVDYPSPQEVKIFLQNIHVINFVKEFFSFYAKLVLESLEKESKNLYRTIDLEIIFNTKTLHDFASNFMLGIHLFDKNIEMDDRFQILENFLKKFKPIAPTNALIYKHITEYILNEKYQKEK